ncbi:hypothetical protein ACFQU7_05305 [Pseudoroseomonas wenyumeiae]
MPRFHAAQALLPSGWARDVLVEADDAGTILAASPGSPAADAARLPGW